MNRSPARPRILHPRRGNIILARRTTLHIYWGRIGPLAAGAGRLRAAPLKNNTPSGSRSVFSQVPQARVRHQEMTRWNHQKRCFLCACSHRCRSRRDGAPASSSRRLKIVATAAHPLPLRTKNVVGSCRYNESANNPARLEFDAGYYQPRPDTSRRWSTSSIGDHASATTSFILPLLKASVTGSRRHSGPKRILPQFLGARGRVQLAQFHLRSHTPSADLRDPKALAALRPQDAAALHRNRQRIRRACD